MTRYLVQPRDLCKRLCFFSFAKNMGGDIGKNINQNLSGKYNQKPLDHANQSTTDAFKTVSKRAVQKAAEATDDSIGNKFVNKITKSLKTSQENISETVINEYDKEIPKERFYIYIYIYIKCFDNLRSIIKV